VPTAHSIARREVHRERHIDSARQDHLLVAAADDLGDRGAHASAVAACVVVHIDGRRLRRGRNSVGEQSLQHFDVAVVGADQTDF